MGEQESEAAKKLCLADEVMNGVVLVAQGLGEIQRSGYMENEYHRVLLLLANGFERLMKVILCLFGLASKRAFPTCNEMKNWGHDLGKLLERIRQKCATPDYADRCPACREDVELFNGTVLQGFLKILTDFGKGGRYHNLDVVGSNDKVEPSPESQWLTHQFAVMLDENEREAWCTDLPHGDDDPLLAKVREGTVILMERFARALARVLTFGPLDSEGKRMHAFVTRFLNLTDGQLGTQDYREMCGYG